MLTVSATRPCCPNATCHWGQLPCHPQQCILPRKNLSCTERWSRVRSEVERWITNVWPFLNLLTEWPAIPGFHPRCNRQNSRRTPQIPSPCCTHSLTQLVNQTLNLGIAMRGFCRCKYIDFKIGRLAGRAWPYQRSPLNPGLEVRDEFRKIWITRGSNEALKTEGITWQGIWITSRSWVASSWWLARKWWSQPCAARNWVLPAICMSFENGLLPRASRWELSLVDTWISAFETPSREPSHAMPCLGFYPWSCKPIWVLF